MSDHRIICGDCLDPVSGLASLPDKSVDHVFTDPPYSEFTHSKGRGNGGIRDDLPEIGFAAITEEQRLATSREWARVVRRWVLVFTDLEGLRPWADAMRVAGLEYVRGGLWMKEGQLPQFSGDRPGTAAEAIAIGHPRGKKRWNRGGHSARWDAQVLALARETRQHTTQKPLALMEALVRDFTDPGDLILDAFAGSGTTGVAAKRLGRRFIGWERDPKYHAIAEKRIAAAREQYVLPIVRERKPEQGTLLVGARASSTGTEGDG